MAFWRALVAVSISRASRLGAITLLVVGLLASVAASTPADQLTAEGTASAQSQPDLGAAPGEAEARAEAQVSEEAPGGDVAGALEALVTQPLDAASQLSGAGPIIGTNDGAGWGAVSALKILTGHITWDRVEIGSPWVTVSTSAADGFKVLAIVQNPDDSTQLSQVEPKAWGAGVASELATHPGISLAEAGNEMYFKGGVANPVQYGRMYLAAISSMKARGIHTPLLFNMAGDYPHGTWSSPTGWSTDAGGGGWLREAVRSNPGLAAAILANGISVHPYGAPGENWRDDFGVASVAGDEAVARTVLGAVPRVYITEFGYDLSRCGEPIGACTPKEQASKLRTAYTVFLNDPHVAGIWWYQSHDDSTGHFGYVNRYGNMRPAFSALEAFALASGQ
jgi:hypothetical protein